MVKIGAVAGSFDPITKGHLWLIREAALLVDELYIVIAKNDAKKSMFTYDERLEICTNAFYESYSCLIHDKITIKPIGNELLFDWANNNQVTHVFRGLRNIQDFTYEQSMRMINHDINPSIATIFFITPPEYSAISSSTVKGVAGVNNWENRINKWVPPSVVKAFTKKFDEQKGV